MGVPQPDGRLAGGCRCHHRTLEPVRGAGAHDDGRRLSLGTAELVGDLHRFENRGVPPGVVSGTEEMRVETARGETACQQRVAAARRAVEVAATPFGVEAVHGGFSGSGPGPGSRRFEDAQHPVREGMRRQCGFAHVRRQRLVPRRSRRGSRGSMTAR